MFDREQFKQNRQAQENGEAPRFIRGKELSDEQYEKFKSGQTIYVDDLVDKKGKTYKGYLTFNVEKGKTEFSFGNPNKQKNAAKQSAQPDETSKVQKAVNSDGKTNEATKNVKEALEKVQTKPTEKQTEKQEKEEQHKRNQGKENVKPQPPKRRLWSAKHQHYNINTLKCQVIIQKNCLCVLSLRVRCSVSRTVI